MSTKIYDGLRLKGNNIKRLYQKLDSIVPELKEAAQNEGYQCISRLFASYYDLKLTNSTILNKLFWKDKEDKMIIYFNDYKYELIVLLADIFNHMNDKMKTSNERNPSFDYNLNLYISTDNKNILIIPHCEHSSILKILKENFEEYGYWNNSDRPENVTNTEWNSRRKAWDDSSKYDFSINFELFSGYKRIFNEFNRDILANNVIKYIKPKEERALTYAQKQLKHKFFLEVTTGINRDEIVNHIFTYESQARDMLNAEENKKLLEDTYNEWLSKINDITIDIIKNYKLSNNPDEEIKLD